MKISRALREVSRALRNVSRALHNNLKKVFLERSKAGSKGLDKAKIKEKEKEEVSNVISPFVNYSRANCVISHKTLNDISTPYHKSVEHEFQVVTINMTRTKTTIPNLISLPVTDGLFLSHLHSRKYVFTCRNVDSLLGECSELQDGRLNTLRHVRNVVEPHWALHEGVTLSASPRSVIGLRTPHTAMKLDADFPV